MPNKNYYQAKSGGLKVFQLGQEVFCPHCGNYDSLAVQAIELPEIKTLKDYVRVLQDHMFKNYHNVQEMIKEANINRHKTEERFLELQSQVILAFRLRQENEEASSSPSE